MNYVSTERVSLFAISDDSAYLVGRFSKFKNLMTDGRDSYPLDQGALGLAYKNSSGVMMDLPDPSTDMDGWVAALVSSGIPETTCRSMTMRARNYFAFQICAAEGDAHPIGLLVVRVS